MMCKYPDIYIVYYRLINIVMKIVEEWSHYLEFITDKYIEHIIIAWHYHSIIVWYVAI